MKDKKQEIIIQIILNAGSMGLHTIEKIAGEHVAIIDKFKKDSIVTDELKKLYIEAVESFLITEIQTVSGYDEKEVLEIYDEFRIDLNLPDAFPDRSSVGILF